MIWSQMLDMTATGSTPQRYSFRFLVPDILPCHQPEKLLVPPASAPDELSDSNPPSLPTQPESKDRGPTTKVSKIMTCINSTRSRSLLTIGAR